MSVAPWERLRRERLERSDEIAIVAVMVVISAAIGIETAVQQVSPTGSTAIDVVLVVLLAGFVTWVAASATWWAVVGLGAVALAMSGLSWWLVAGVVTVVIGAWFARSRSRVPWLGAAAAGLALMAMLQAQVDPFLGSSAVVVGVVLLIFCSIALSRRERHVRRRVGWSLGALAVAVVLALVGLGAGGLQARTDVENGADHLTEGLDLLRDGDTPAAAAALRAAADDLRRASDAVSAPWTQPSRVLPVVAQHRDLVTELVDQAATSAAVAADALTAADLERLRVQDGTLDVDALAELAGPLSQLDHAVRDIDAVLGRPTSPWLIGPLRDALTEVGDDVAAAAVQSRATAAAARYGPVMLGSDGPRTYLVVFTAPTQARGQSGAIVNWAEVVVDDGHLDERATGRVDDLVVALTAPGRTATEPSALVLDVSPEFFRRYGADGAGGPTVGVSPSFWNRVTMTPDGPTAASVMAQMYEAGSGIDVDGVFVMDPTAVASLLRVAGPVRIDAIDRSIDADSLEQFLLVDQFNLDEAVRRDAAEAVSALALEQFLTTTLPEPQRVGELLGPAATEGHIVGWAERADEQDVFRLIGMAGELPRPDGRDGLAVVNDNVGGNSIDGFLERSTRYEADYDGATGDVDGEVVITLRNTAPSAGLPDDVIGNELGLPGGTNRTRLTLYSPLSIGEITVDGAEPTVAEALSDGRIDGNERGWNTASWVIDIPAGETVTVRIRVTGSVSAERYEFVWRPQPVVRNDPLTLDVRAAGDSDPVAQFDGELPRTSVVVGHDTAPLR